MLDLAALLKKKPTGEEAIGWLKMRLQVQITDPLEDKLSRELIKPLHKIIPTLSGTFLDVGCLTGWVYHYVKDVVDYHGIDIYKEAIAAAQAEFPPERFSVEDLRSCKRKADIVWGSQLHPELDIEVFLPKLAEMSNGRVFWTQTRLDGEEHSRYFKEVKYHDGIFEGIK